MLLLAMALCAVVLVGTSCGSSSGNNSNLGTAAGNYTVTVTGTPQTGSPQTTTLMLSVP